MNATSEGSIDLNYDQSFSNISNESNVSSSQFHAKKRGSTIKVVKPTLIHKKNEKLQLNSSSLRPLSMQASLLGLGTVMAAVVLVGILRHYVRQRDMSKRLREVHSDHRFSRKRRARRSRSLSRSRNLSSDRGWIWSMSTIPEQEDEDLIDQAPGLTHIPPQVAGLHTTGEQPTPECSVESVSTTTAVAHAELSNITAQSLKEVTEAGELNNFREARLDAWLLSSSAEESSTLADSTDGGGSSDAHAEDVRAQRELSISDPSSDPPNATPPSSDDQGIGHVTNRYTNPLSSTMTFSSSIRQPLRGLRKSMDWLERRHSNGGPPSPTCSSGESMLVPETNVERHSDLESQSGPRFLGEDDLHSTDMSDSNASRRQHTRQGLSQLSEYLKVSNSSLPSVPEANASPRNCSGHPRRFIEMRTRHTAHGDGNQNTEDQVDASLSSSICSPGNERSLSRIVDCVPRPSGPERNSHESPPDYISACPENYPSFSPMTNLNPQTVSIGCTVSSNLPQSVVCDSNRSDNTRHGQRRRQERARLHKHLFRVSPLVTRPNPLESEFLHRNTEPEVNLGQPAHSQAASSNTERVNPISHQTTRASDRVSANSDGPTFPESGVRTWRAEAGASRPCAAQRPPLSNDICQGNVFVQQLSNGAQLIYIPAPPLPEYGEDSPPPYQQ